MSDQKGGDEDESALELYENCLQALESIIRRCPTTVKPFLKQIVALGKSVCPIK